MFRFTVCIMFQDITTAQWLKPYPSLTACQTIFIPSDCIRCLSVLAKAEGTVLWFIYDLFSFR